MGINVGFAMPMLNLLYVFSICTARIITTNIYNKMSNNHSYINKCEFVDQSITLPRLPLD